MDYLRSRRICCASYYLCIPGTLSWCVLGVSCPTFRQIYLPWGFVVGGLLRLCWVFSDTLVWRVLGLIRHALLAHSGCCLGGPFPNNCPQKNCIIGVGWWICQVSIFGATWGHDLSFASISWVSTALPWRRACLVCLWHPLFFKVACLLALLWRACFNSDCLTVYVGRPSCQTPTFFSSTVSCHWSYFFSASVEDKRFFLMRIPIYHPY